MPPFSLPSLAYNPVALGAFDTVETYPRAMVTAGAVTTANQMYIAKVRFPRALTVSAMLIYVTVTGNNVDLGIYDCATAGLHDASSTLRWLGSTGSTAVGAANAVQSIALTASVNVVTGKDYWLALAADNATPAFGRIGPVGLFMTYDLRTGTKATSFPLPTTTVTTFGNGSNTPWLAAVGS